jgi:hypothetical protein
MGRAKGTALRVNSRRGQDSYQLPVRVTMATGRGGSNVAEKSARDMLAMAACGQAAMTARSTATVARKLQADRRVQAVVRAAD